MMRLPLFVALLVGLSGCAWWGDENPCESAEEYQRSTSVPPVVVPDGMDRPDGAGRLVVPGGPLPTEPLEKTAACLQQPPNYFDRPVYVPKDD